MVSISNTYACFVQASLPSQCPSSVMLLSNRGIPTKQTEMKKPAKFTFEQAKRPSPLKRSKISRATIGKSKLVSFKRKRGSSKYKGVLFVRKQRKWRAQICHKGKKYYLGSFATEIEAALVRDERVKEMFGKNCRTSLNFPNRVTPASPTHNFEKTQLSPTHCWSWVKPLPSPQYYYWSEYWNQDTNLFLPPLADEEYGEPYLPATDIWSFDKLGDEIDRNGGSIISPRVLKS